MRGQSFWESKLEHKCKYENNRNTDTSVIQNQIQLQGKREWEVLREQSAERSHYHWGSIPNRNIEGRGGAWK